MADGFADAPRQYGGDTREGEVDLFALFRFLWDAKALIILGALAFGVVGFAYATYATKWYRVVSVYTPRTSGNSGGLESLGERVAPLAALAGVNLGGTVSPAQHHADIIGSGQFLRRFAEQTDLKAKLFAKQWRPERRQWINAKGKPVSEQELLKELEDVIFVDYDAAKMQLNIIVDWTDPDAAVRWANSLVPAANRYIRAKELERANYNIGFLRRELELARYPYVQEALANLLTSQVERRMLILNSPDYAFVSLDPAVRPLFHSYPRRLLFTIFGILIGSLIGALVAYGLMQRRRSRTA